MKRLLQKIKTVIMLFLVVTLSLPLTSLATVSAAPATGVYTSGDSSIPLDVQLTGSSINDHIIPYKLWTSLDKVYVAVKSTHDLEYMKLQGVINDNMDVYQPWENISINGQSYAPTGLNGSVNKSHWTVFDFPLSTIAGATTFSFEFFINGIGGGHDVSGTFAVIIPNVTINLSKTWVNGPKTPVSVQLYHQIAGGTEEAYLEPFTLSIDNPTRTLTDLPYTDNGGRIYTYSFKESNPGEGYKVTSTSSYDATNRTYTFVLTNTYKAPTGPIVATKTWVHDYFSTPYLYFSLYRKTVNSTDAPVYISRQRINPESEFMSFPRGHTKSYDFIWNDMPLTDEFGNQYEYFVKEVDNVGTSYEGSVGIGGESYEITINGPLHITNRVTSNMVATKSWRGGTYGNRPEVYFTLYRAYSGANIHDVAGWERVPGEQPHKMVTNIVTLTWDYAITEWRGLQKHDPSGNWYAYTVFETDENGNQSNLENYKIASKYLNVTGNTHFSSGILNEYVPPKTFVEATKAWVNGPAEKPTVWFKLYRQVQGGAVEAVPTTEAPIKELANGTTSVAWDNLTETDANGNKYTFSVKEVDATGASFTPTNYVKSGEESLAITNTYKIPTGPITVTKVWLHGQNLFAPNVYLQLYRKLAGSGDAPVTVSNGLKQINRYDVMPQVNDSFVYTSKSRDFTWDNMPLTDEAGNAYEYSVKEVDNDGNILNDTIIHGYGGSEDFEVTGSGLTITNRSISSLIAFKSWVGGPTEKPEVYLTLFRSSSPADLDLNNLSGWERVPETEATVQRVDGHNRFYEWNKLTYRDADGNRYYYLVFETDKDGNGITLPNYQTVYYRSANGTGSTFSTSIHNTYVPPLTNVTATKRWVDGPAPVAIEFQLYRQIAGGDKEVVGSPVILNPGTLTYTWRNLPATDKNGNTYDYSVKEVTVLANYQIEENGLNVVNTYAIPKTEVSAKKAWTNVPEGTTYPTVYFQLYRGLGSGAVSQLIGQPLKSPTAANNWTVSWSNLDKTDIKGVPYHYEVREWQVPSGFNSTTTGDEENGFVIANTYTGGPVRTVKVRKSWGMNPTPTGEYPAVQIQLYRKTATIVEETVGEPITIPAGDATTVDKEWANLPTFGPDGRTYTYSVKEVNVPEGFAVSYSGNQTQGFVITNALKDAKIHLFKHLLKQDNQAVAGQEFTFRLDGQSAVGDSRFSISIPGQDKFVISSGETFVLPSGNSALIEGIKVGAPFTITEVDANGYDVMNGVGATPGTWEFDNNRTVTIDKPYDQSPTLTIQFRNQLSGQLIIEKQFRNSQGEVLDMENLPAEITVRVTGPNGYDEIVTVPAGSTLQLDNLLYGEYTITEVSTTDNFQTSIIEKPLDEDITADDLTAGATLVVTLASGQTTYAKVARISNVYQSPKTDIKVTKIWDGGPIVRPMVEFQLYRDGLAFGSLVQLVGETEYVWQGVDLTDLNGTPYKYTVKETGITSYLSKVEGSVEDGFVVTNTWFQPGMGDVPLTGAAPTTMSSLIALFAFILMALGIRGLKFARQEN